MPTPNPTLSVASSIGVPSLTRALRCLLSRSTLDINIKDLCKESGMRRSQFWKHCIEQLGGTPSQTLDCLRVARMLCRLKANPNEKIHVISKTLGFENDSSMSRFCGRMFGMRPCDVKGNLLSACLAFATAHAQLAQRITDIVGAEFPETNFICATLSLTAKQEPNARTKRKNQTQEPNARTKRKNQTQEPNAQRNFLTKRR
jgi:AraC-like DNA-binding protein